MLQNVQNALDSVLGSSATLRNSRGAGRMFELFVMTGIARKLVDEGFNVWLQRSDGTPIAPGDPDRRFIQRGGAPTGVMGVNQGPNNASVIGFRGASGQAWEIWNGIQFEGRSGALHEIDLAIVPRDVGETLRAQPSGGIPVGRPRIAIECKDVGAAGSVDEMRAFVARLYDLTLLEVHHNFLPYALPRKAIHPGAPPGNTHEAAETFRDENMRTLNIVARRTGFASGAMDMTQYYWIEAHDGITAGAANAQDLIISVVDWIVDNNY